MRWRWLGGALGLVLAAGVGLAPAARAFHSQMLFPDDASVGGGGGLYYNGSPRHKRYTCEACHIDPPGLARLVVTSEPPALIDEGTYDPDALYSLTVRLAGETRGLDAAKNYNTFAVEIIDAELRPVGQYLDFAAGGLVTTIAFDALFARARDELVATEWHFDWQAPPAGTGPVTLYLAGVDGDGAGSKAVVATDPLGDDVMVAEHRLFEAGQPRPTPPASSGCQGGGAGAGAGGAGLGLAAALALALGRRRRATARRPPPPPPRSPIWRASRGASRACEGGSCCSTSGPPGAPPARRRCRSTTRGSASWRTRG
jgi:hypothetical protein